jgi:NAD(P)H-hydrate repair Nnr-like enzyme with NAD(P)H-hydrate dehydratase domain
MAGDLAAASKGQAGMIASDLAEQIPYALKHVVETEQN